MIRIFLIFFLCIPCLHLSYSQTGNKKDVTTIRQLRKGIQRSVKLDVKSIEDYCGVLLLEARFQSNEIELHSLYSSNEKIADQVDIMEQRLNSFYRFLLDGETKYIPVVFSNTFNGYARCNNTSEFFNLLRKTDICSLEFIEEVQIIKKVGDRTDLQTNTISER